MAQNYLFCANHLKSLIMAKLNRDYGKGREFLFWTLMFALALTALMVWLYRINFTLSF